MIIFRKVHPADKNYHWTLKKVSCKGINISTRSETFWFSFVNVHILKKNNLKFHKFEKIFSMVMLLIKTCPNMAVSCPHTFHLEAIIIRSYPWWQEDSSSTSWNLFTKFIYAILSYKGFLKSEKEVVRLFKFHKSRNFFSFIKN